MPDRQFGIETLCLHAGQLPDPATGARAARIADCKEVVIRDRGDMMMQEAPDASLDALIANLQAD